MARNNKTRARQSVKRGIAFLMQDASEKATADYNRAIAIAPNYTNAYQRLQILSPKHSKMRHFRPKHPNTQNFTPHQPKFPAQNT